MTAAALTAFKQQAVATRAALWPGTISINGTDYAGAVVATKGARESPQGEWVQVRTITAEIKITVMALAIVLDTQQPTQPLRDGLILTHGGITYRLTEVHADPHGVFTILRGEEEHPAGKD